MWHSWAMGLLAWLVVGLIAGAIARLLVPKSGRHLGCIGTTGLGMLGSLVGGGLFSVLAGDGARLRTSGFIGSIIGAVLILVVARIFRPEPARR